jgi:hypothetical protein
MDHSFERFVQYGRDNRDDEINLFNDLGELIVP